jgi:transmembrane sensor
MSDVRAHRARSGERQPSSRWSVRTSRLAASIAALALVGGLTVAGLYALQGPGSDTYSTKVGELRRIVLQDGSLLTLNTDSVAQVSYSSGHRKVQLVRGEALFTVAHHANRPFDVMASALVVRAVGTQFSVRVRDESSVDVLLTEGRLALNTPSSPTLSAGSMALYRNGQVTTVQLSPSDITDALGWSAVTNPQLHFRGETLASVAAEMNRYNLVKIVVPDPAVAQRRIGGKYPALEPEGFASHIAPALGVRARLLDGGSVISLETQSP